MTGRRLVAVVVLVVIVTLGLATPAGTQDTSGIELQLAAQKAWQASGEPLDLALDLGRLTQTERIDVVVDARRAVRSQREFTASLDGGLPTQRAMNPVTLRLGDLPRDANGYVALHVALPSLAPGVYPVSVTLRDRDSGQVLDRLITHVVRVPETVVQPLRVAWVQPFSAPPSRQPDGELAVDGDEALAITRLAGAIGVRPSVPMTLDITPETLETYATADPGAVAAIRTAARGRQVLAAPYVEVDPTAFVDAGLGADLSAQRLAGEAPLREAIANPGDPRTWSSETALSPQAAAQLRLMGVSQVVVPAANLSPIDPDAVDGRSLDRPFGLDAGDGEVIGALVADVALTAHFVDDGDQVLAGHHLLADLAVRHNDWPAIVRGVVIRPPSDWNPSSVFAATVLTGLAEATIVRPLTVEALVSDVPRLEQRGQDVVRTAENVEPRRPLGSLPVNEGRAAIDGLRSLSPGVNEEGVDLERAVLIAESDDLNMSARRAYLDDIFGRVESIEGGIRLVAGRTFRLAGRSGTIPLTLVNDNPFPTVVALELFSDKLEFEDGIGPDRSTRYIPSIELGPGQTTVVPVDVRARASAAFSMRAILRMPNTGDELSRGRYTVVSPAVPNVGIALSVGAGLFLLVWWIRNWRKTRRSAVVPSTPAPVSTEHAVG